MEKTKPEMTKNAWAQRRWRKNNPEKKKASQAAWYKKFGKEYYQKYYKEKGGKEYSKKYYEAHKKLKKGLCTCDINKGLISISTCPTHGEILKTKNES